MRAPTPLPPPALPRSRLTAAPCQRRRIYDTSHRARAGLTAAVIVSQWTWAATLLQSSNVSWKYGISGPFWYASGATIQILLFAILAIQIKIRAPHMHTYLEVIKIRWGTTSHVVFMVFGFLCNCIVTSMLMLGGAATIEDLTGMSRTWCSFLIPLGVLIYTFNGGLRATFFASYIHTGVIFAMLALFGFSAYTGSTPGLGGAGEVYDSLTAASLAFASGTTIQFPSGMLGNAGKCYDVAALALPDFAPVADGSTCNTGTNTSFYDASTVVQDAEPLNSGSSCTYSLCADGVCAADTPGALSNGAYAADGQGQWAHDCGEGQGTCVPAYYTMTSAGGLSFGIINIVGNFGTVFVDQSYWQSAIAAEPKATVNGFLIGGMVWFAVPFFMATTFGLAGRSLSMSKGIDFITAAQAGNGLVPARTIVESIGSGGAFCLLLQLFMAVTSTGSAEVIAVSSILTYDLYWTYLNPELKDGVTEGKTNWDKAMTAAGLAADSEPSTEVDDTAAGKLFQALTDSGWAKAGADAKSGADLLKGGNKLFEVKATAVADLGKTTEGVILVRMSRFFACLFAIFMGFLSVLLNQLGLGLGWVYMAMGNIIGSAVVPCAMAILYTNANGPVCTAAAIIGFICAMLGWILKANADYGEVTIDTMGTNDPNLIGNIVALLSSALICIAGSMAMGPSNPGLADVEGADVKAPFNWDLLETLIPVVDDVVPELKDGETPAELKVEAKRANWQAIILTFILILAWPIPMHLTQGVMGKGGFTIWIAVAFGWGIIGGVVIIVLPILDWVKKKSPAPKVESA